MITRKQLKIMRIAYKLPNETGNKICYASIFKYDSDFYREMKRLMNMGFMEKKGENYGLTLKGVALLLIMPSD